jgi:chromosome partitioning protein
MTAPHWAYSTHKGGVGKTLEVLLDAAAAAEAGHRVLVVDMDAQANATRRLHVDLPADPDEKVSATLAGILTRPRRGDVASVIRPCGWGGIYTERIDVAPGHLDLELLASTAAQAGSEKRLLTALAGAVEDYDIVLIDCPPNLLSHLIDNVWTASDLVFVPVEPEYDAIEAARRVSERVAADRDTLNPELMVGGFIINRYRAALSLHQARADEVATIAGPDAVCPIRLPELVTLKNSTETGAPLSAQSGSQAAAMGSLARDIYEWKRERTRTLMGVPA